MKTITVFTLLVSMTTLSLAQNVGIGTTTPPKRLSVNGSILLDSENTNSGSVDSAALVFGTQTHVGLSCNRNIAGIVPNGLTFWTAGQRRMCITNTGQVGINTVIPTYTLDVSGSMHASSIVANLSVSSNGYVSAESDLIASHNLTIGHNAMINGNTGLGMNPSDFYRLSVTGPSRYYDNVGMDGTLRVDKRITNQGNGIMISDGATTLQSGFTWASFSLSLGPGGFYDLTVYTTQFSGGNDNIRVMVSQFVPGAAASSNWGNIIMTPHSVNPSDSQYGGSTVKIRFQNPTDDLVNLGTNAKIYLYSVATHTDPQ